ncbi:MAG: EamA family transporter [Bacteroidia bacterium]|nr:MAG: EamA family transporter [Bacteroidia bacterium]
MGRSKLEFVLAMLIFGLNGVLASAIPWHSYEIVLARTTVGALTMLAILRWQRRRFAILRSRGALWLTLGSGVLMGISWLGLYEAYTRLGVGLAQMLSSSGPAVAMVLSPLIFREKLQRTKVIGFAVVLTGMLLISSEDLTGGQAFGLLCGLLACLAYAAFLICNHRPLPMTPAERTMWQLVTASVIVMAFIAYRGTGLPDTFAPRALIAALILGVVNTGLATSMMFAALQKIPMQTVGILAYLEPMSAIVFSALLLGEQLGPLQLGGVALILGGTAFAELYPGRHGRG